MTRARSALIALDDTPWYHVVNRCVRRAFLCGQDGVTGQDYEHRAALIERRIRQLAAVFAIDIAAYAVMSNHYHVIIRVDQERAQHWSEQEVLRRWTTLFTGPLLVRQSLGAKGAGLLPSESTRVSEWAAIYRQRLFDVSWFLRVLNGTIARMANAEDNCRGRFWEGRFRSQALLDEQALLAAMAYVDLNPIRAGMATSLDSSAHTSVRLRLRAIAQHEHVIDGDTPESASDASDDRTSSDDPLTAVQPAPLMPFDITNGFAQAVPFGLVEYLDLLDTMGRQLHPKKRGVIAGDEPALLVRLGLDSEAFVRCADHFFRDFAGAVGTPATLIDFASSRQKRAMRGMAKAKSLFPKNSGCE